MCRGGCNERRPGGEGNKHAGAPVDRLRVAAVRPCDKERIVIRRYHCTHVG